MLEICQKCSEMVPKRFKSPESDEGVSVAVCARQSAEKLFANQCPQYRIGGGKRFFPGADQITSIQSETLLCKLCIALEQR